MNTYPNRLFVSVFVLASFLLMASCDYPDFQIPTQINTKDMPTITEIVPEDTATDNLDLKTTFAIINGIPVSKKLYSLYEVQRRSKRPVTNKNNENNELKNEFINMELLAQDAIIRGLDKNEALYNGLLLQKKSILVNAVIKEIQQENPITEKQLNDEYQTKYMQAIHLEYSTRHILVKEEPKAKGIIKKLNGGEDFSTLAINHSVGPAAKEGGALEWFKPEDVIPEFYSAVAKLKKGRYTMTPVKSKYGWHVILLENTRQGKAPDFELVKNRLKMDIQARRLEQYIQNLRDQSNIQVLSESRTR